MLDEAAFAQWLSRYRAVWETQDPAAAMALFTADATYRETPFDLPMVGRVAIAAYWRDRVGQQSNIAFAADVITVVGDTGLAHWQASFEWRPTGQRMALDGIFRCRFRGDGAGAGLCAALEEWWHLRETGPAAT